MSRNWDFQLDPPTFMMPYFGQQLTTFKILAKTLAKIFLIVDGKLLYII